MTHQLTQQSDDCGGSLVRLAAGYFVYCTAVGIFTPFWSPYLVSRGFSALEVSWLLAVGAAVRSCGPMLVGWLADLNHPTWVLRLAALIGVASFAVLPQQAVLTGFIVFCVVYALSWTSIGPLIDVHTLAHLGAGSFRYGRIRLWGSIGFIVSSWLGGAFFERMGYAVLPRLMLCLAGGTLVATLLVQPIVRTVGAVADAPFGASLRSRATLVSLSVAALIAVSFGAYYVFFTLYLSLHGYGKQTIGALWALGVLAEVVVFAFGPSLLLRFPIRSLFALAAAGTCVRWLAVAWFVQYPWVLAASQLLHGLGFAVLHFAIVLSAQALFPERSASRGQTLFNSVGYGVGGMVGNLLAGVMWVQFSPQASYVSAAFIVVLAAALAWVGLRGTVLADRSAGAPA